MKPRAYGATTTQPRKNKTTMGEGDTSNNVLKLYINISRGY